ERRTDLTQPKTEVSDLRAWKTRLGLSDDHPFQQERDFSDGLHRLGYELNAVTSANPLTEESRFRFFVDNLVSVGQFENCLERSLPKIDLSRPQCLILNLCETHYPYFDGAYDRQFDAYYLHGFAAQMRAAAEDRVLTVPNYPAELMPVLRARQIESIRYLDSVIPKLFKLLPPATYVTITSDHGDCLGEDGFVGHGEVWNKMVLEVPFLEGRVPS
ncbi:MAG TPA: sulfatase-like hydrolase/transferase, partial [Stellaceae bacterium]|nr:sulfatase-like hydrolase/transferase [Stellaceae bacterium]